MTVRLQYRAIAIDIDTAHLPAGAHPDELIPHPLTTPPPTHPNNPPPHPTPVAALLQRAHHRITHRGWTRDHAIDSDGRLCPAWAIHTEADGDTSLETTALNHLLETIRQHLDPQAETIPAWNDSHPDGHMPLRILNQAADNAANRGI